MTVHTSTNSFLFVLATSVATLSLGCAGIGGHPSLGFYNVDAEQLVVLDVEGPDTITIVTFGEALEVINVTPSELLTAEQFVVRYAGRLGRIERDYVMSDILFRSKYTNGQPVYGVAGARYYLDEFRDTVQIRWQENVARKPGRDDSDGTTVTEKPAAKKKRRR